MADNGTPRTLYTNVKAACHAITFPLVQARKKIVSWLEKKWPSQPVDTVLDVVYQRFPQGHELRKSVPGMPSERQQEEYARSKVPIIVDPRYGVLFSGHRIVWDSSDFPYRERDIDFLAALRPAGHVAEAIITHGHFSGSYYHFFDDFLVKAIAAEEWNIPDDIPLLIPSNIYETPFFEATERQGFFGSRPLLLVPKGRSYAVDVAHVVRAPILDHRRFDEIARRYPQPKMEATRHRILLDRSGDFGRKIANRSQIDQVLKRHGIQTVILEDLPLIEQIESFRQASLVVAAHGAGLVNMLFSSKPCAIIEISPSAFRGTDAYMAMAAQREFPFRRIFAQSERGKASRANFIVDPIELSAAIEGVLGDLEM